MAKFSNNALRLRLIISIYRYDHRSPAYLPFRLWLLHANKTIKEGYLKGEGKESKQVVLECEAKDKWTLFLTVNNKGTPVESKSKDMELEISIMGPLKHHVNKLHPPESHTDPHIWMYTTVATVLLCLFGCILCFGGFVSSFV